MKSYLIKDTTKIERINLIKEWQGPDDCEGGSGIDLFDMYNDYINGVREISEINASFQANYVKSEEELEDRDAPKSAEIVSTADEIIKLKNLLDQGVLTQDEFEAAKKKALGL